MAKRVDLEAMRPFMAGWRAEIVATYSADDIERLARQGRERRADAQRMAAERRYEKWDEAGLMADIGEG